MKNISVADLATAIGGTITQQGTRPVTAGLTTDSRAVTPGSIFLALCGERFDGNDYAAQASGTAAAVVVSRCTGQYAEACTVITVSDTLAALQALATWWRAQLEPIRVIGLTGSSGKTSTKDMCLAVLSCQFNTTATKGNLNNHIGTPLSILATEKGTEAAIWEMGMNHAGELAPLCRMTQPHIGIITTIGSAHMEYLGSREAIAQEKCTLARCLPADGYMIYPATDDFATTIAASTKATPLPVGGCDSLVRALNVRTTAAGSSYDLYIAELGTIRIDLPVPGTHMVSNSLLAAAAGWKCGCSLQAIAHGLSRSTLTHGRLACKEADGYTIIDDTYNANPESMKAALDTVAAMRGPARRFAVLGKMGELGAGGITAHYEIGLHAAACGFAALVVVGDECAETTALCQGAADRIPAVLVNSPAEAAAALRQMIAPGDAILFKGSRSAGMERSMYELFPSLKSE
ncbi:MAG: UDP-N-acetylmuramoyl-tripeptide--D-alanyl-D-alanine ligase [Akkermansiaceae bacterium]|nr:UDP-N-acetylmuramoyl-tripeptide--D-alanyl-D-alanine ligase [Akkermansiaceae bacterium]